MYCRSGCFVQGARPAFQGVVIGLAQFRLAVALDPAAVLDGNDQERHADKIGRQGTNMRIAFSLSTA
jgi:hypothetical protein